MRLLRKLIAPYIEAEVKAVVQREVDRRVFAYMRKRFADEPNIPLTTVGFAWAFSFALQRYWPDVQVKQASRWVWDYVGVPHGTAGYEWTPSAAASLAISYAQEFGE